MTDLSQIRHDVNSIRQELKNHQILSDQRQKVTDDKIDELNKNVSRLITLLEGDPADPNRGFFQRIIAIEKFITGLKDTKSYLAGKLAGAILIITMIGTFIAFVLKVYDFFKK